MSDSDHPLLKQIESRAKACVMCGICMPYCPTFGQSGHEADGPRGRIRLMLSLAEGELTADAPGVQAHLQRCLTCRACESACPSKVEYGALIDDTRALLAQTAPQARPDPEKARKITWWRDHLLSHRRRLGWVWQLQQRLATQKLRPVAKHIAGPLAPLLPLTRIHSIVPKKLKISPNPVGRRVGLFIGCTGNAANRNAAEAARKVLPAFGFEVIEPTEQNCCGAIYSHDGQTQIGTRQKEHTEGLFADKEVETIVVIGSACAAQLNPAQAVEITHFLNQIPAKHWPPLNRLDRRVAIHTPCSQRNALKQPNAAFELLERIAGLTCLALADNERCCGAGGLQALYFPEQASALLAPKLANASEQQAEAIITTNVGCAVHMQSQDKRPVYQPVELLAEALADH